MKLSICTIFCVFLVFMCNAQGKFLGIHHGWSSNNAIGSQAVKTHSLQGEQWMLQYEIRRGDRLGYSIAARYSSKGFFTRVVLTDDMGNPTGEELDLNNEFTYISIPIKTGFFVGKKISGFGYAGLAPSILVNAYQDSYDGSDLISEDVSSKPEKFDLQLLLEVGAHYQVTKNFGLMSSIQLEQSIFFFSNRSYYKDWKMRHFAGILNFGLTYKMRTEQAKKPFVVY